MAEEQRLQEPSGGHRLCANNCGFFGSPTTQNLCSKCYKDHCIKEQQMEEAKLVMETTLTQSHQLGSSSSSKFQEPSANYVLVCPGEQPKLEVQESNTTNGPDYNKVAVEEQHKAPMVAVAEAIRPNRCPTCRKRVGLTGFKCRCGVTFCGTHRYPEQHDCSFDYKAMGKKEITKANPVVKAKKLEKI